MSSDADISMPTPEDSVSQTGSRPTIQYWRLWYYLFTNLRTIIADALTVFGGQTIEGGFDFEEFDLGTPTNGSTVTPNPTTCLKQTLTNNVAAFTIAATSEVGDLELRIVNGASAGTITFSGFSKQFPGDPLTTVNGSQFVVFIYGWNVKKAYTIRALQ